MSAKELTGRGDQKIGSNWLAGRLDMSFRGLASSTYDG
jgi:hypothetical protein